MVKKREREREKMATSQPIDGGLNQPHIDGRFRSSVQLKAAIEPISPSSPHLNETNRRWRRAGGGRARAPSSARHRQHRQHGGPVGGVDVRIARWLLISLPKCERVVHAPAPPPGRHPKSLNICI